MKHILFILLIVVQSSFISAQDTGKETKPPQIITKLPTGKTINFNDVRVQFLKVLEDSRCPSGVNCVWEGQAKVLIGIYKDDTLIEEKEIIIGAKEIRPDNPKELLTFNDKVVYIYNLSPYPSSNKKTNPLDYYLELLVK
ncbi:hypothetical protein ACWGOQ_0000610 [Aquimarina sp. M1]